MKKLFLLTMWVALALVPGSAKEADDVTNENGTYVMVSNYVKSDGSEDVADAIQKLIDDNPNRTLFFSDGVYLLSHPLLTPADPTKSVHLVLANYAVLKATKQWKEGALVQLGGKYPFNTTDVNGSNYGIEGGIFDGNGVADGIYIESGRETRINHVSIKHTQVGLHIKYGANSGSSDSDIADVNIVGNNTKTSIGVLVEGYDNTFTNMRIASVNVGVWCKSGGNSFKNIHPLFRAGESQDYNTSRGFVVEASNCLFDYCYSDQFATAFKLSKNVYAQFVGCWAFWWNGKVPFQTAIECDGPLESYFTGMFLGFKKECATRTLLKATLGGKGCIDNTKMPDFELTPDDVSTSYVR